MVNLKYRIQRKFSRIKEKIKRMGSRKNTIDFVKGFLFGFALCAFVMIFNTVPVSASDLAHDLIENCDNKKCNQIDKQIGPQIIKDAERHISSPRPGLNSGSIAAKLVTTINANYALYLGISSGILIGILVFAVQQQFIKSYRRKLLHDKKI